MVRGAIRFIFSVVRLLLLPILMVTWTPVPEKFNEIPPVSRFGSVQEKKRIFLAYLKPIVNNENNRILEQRRQLVTIHQAYLKNGGFSRKEQQQFDKLCGYYKIKYADPGLVDVWLALFMRVDIIPLKLALAQSASESAWGTSRFTRLGNSFFGQWTYTKGWGIKPLKRKDGQKHRVAGFPSARESTRSYMRNLNTHWAYQSFRQMRYDQRQKGEEPDGLQLASGLMMYSQRRELYVNEIKSIIRKNQTLMEQL